MQEGWYRVISLGSCVLYGLGLHSRILLLDPCSWLLRVLDFCPRGTSVLLRISCKLSLCILYHAVLAHPGILFGRPSLELPKQGF